MAIFQKDDPENRDRMRAMMGPGQVDQMIRQAVHLAWMMLPDEKRTVEEVERVIRQIVDRTFKDVREDSQTFGL
jgi:hypothetical protein